MPQTAGMQAFQARKRRPMRPFLGAEINKRPWPIRLADFHLPLIFVLYTSARDGLVAGRDHR